MSSVSHFIQPTGAFETSTSFHGALRPGSSLFALAWHTLHLWHARATQRDQLARLDEHLLRDVGLSRAEADEEAAKPFWRA